MGYEFPSGLALFIMGIAFLWNRILYIKKGNIALATMFKREECLDSDNSLCYIHCFKFTTPNNKEIIYKHSYKQSKYAWLRGQQEKVVYREGLFNDHEILLLTFFNVFDFSIILLAIGSALLIIAGGVYFNVSGKTLALLVPAFVCVFIAVFNFWANRFFNSLKLNERTNRPGSCTLG